MWAALPAPHCDTGAAKQAGGAHTKVRRSLCVGKGETGKRRGRGCRARGRSRSKWVTPRPLDADMPPLPGASGVVVAAHVGPSKRRGAKTGESCSFFPSLSQPRCLRAAWAAGLASRGRINQACDWAHGWPGHAPGRARSDTGEPTGLSEGRHRSGRNQRPPEGRPSRPWGRQRSSTVLQCTPAMARPGKQAVAGTHRPLLRSRHHPPCAQP